MGISRYVPLFIEDQSFRFYCRREILWTPANCVPVHFAFGWAFALSALRGVVIGQFARVPGLA